MLQSLHIVNFAIIEDTIIELTDGATVFTGLTAIGNGRYEGGDITDPETGKTYSMSATLNGTSLDVRGYIGVTVLGRTQTWQKK